MLTLPDVTAGVLAPARLQATMRSAGLDVRYGGTSEDAPTCTVKARRAGSADWWEHLPLWPVRQPDAAGYGAFYGSLRGLRPGTAYDLALDVGGATITATATTRPDAIPPAETLVPTHYVRAGGSDIADGLTPATAWATLTKAIASCPPGAVIQLGPGQHVWASPWSSTNSQDGLKKPVTVVAQFPCLDDDRAPINHGLWSTVVPPAAYRPTAWTQVSPTVWMASTGKPGIQHLHRSVGDRLHRAAQWKRDTRDLSTPAGWMGLLATNRSYHYGFYAAGNVTGDVYLRLPGDRDPNAEQIHVQDSRIAFMLQASGSRISGLHIPGWHMGVALRRGIRDCVVDHCWIDGAYAGVYFHSNTNDVDVLGYPAGGGHVVEHTLITDRGLRDPEASGPVIDGEIIPWAHIKSRELIRSDGSVYPTDRLGGASETFGIYGRGGHGCVTIRHCTIDGTFNGISPGANAGYGRMAGSGMDVYDCDIRNLADDALEPEGAAINLRAWGNRIDRTLTFVSAGPVHYGPVETWDNDVTRWGAAGCGAYADNPDKLNGVALKYSGQSDPPALVRVLGGLLWTDDPTGYDTGQWAGNGTSPERFQLRGLTWRLASSNQATASMGDHWDEADCTVHVGPTPWLDAAISGRQ